ncbi:MAG: methionine--tRNA ligase [Planctomycetota bacterium]|nr:MAG: methionine--tRNA ligase [Planctomycetota bacterium]
MSTEKKPYYITTPIYYVNDRPHIGHCYTTTVADVAARFARLLGRDVFFLTGTDEHAEKVVTTARERGHTPQEWADINAAEFQKAFDLMSIHADDFMRTSQERHKARAAAYIAQLKDSDDIYEGEYEGWYDPSQEEYLTETVAKEADYKSPVTGKPLEKRSEKNWFFRLSKYEERLHEALRKGEAGEPGGYRILPEARRNEVLGRLKQGLNDVPVSRAVKEGDADWGILMPGDPSHRVYVWIEALCNYLSAVDNEREPSTAEAEGGSRERYWPAAVHVMAKDILWFHAVVWPAMLMAMDKKLPEVVYAHAYFVAEGTKMSKSLGNFIEIDQLEAYSNWVLDAERKQAEKEGREPRPMGIDAVRWFLATNGPLGANDADFAHAKFVEVYNADLANGIGNCASRVSNMIEKYFDGVVPDPSLCPDFVWEAGESESRSQGWWPARARYFVDRASEAHTEFGLYQSLLCGSALAGIVDQFINDTRPFSLAKQIDEEGVRERLATILYSCAEAIRIASLLLFPALPSKMAELWRAWDCSPLNDPDDPNSGFKAPLEELAAWGGEWSLKPGQRITKGPALFMRASAGEAMPTTTA